MSRQLKFRAWFEGHMYEIAKLDFWGDPDQATCDMVRMSLTEEGYAEEIFEVYLHEVELMQYTGLKDKNGKEIYEGDIHEYGGRHFSVKFGYYTDEDTNVEMYGWYLGSNSIEEQGSLGVDSEEYVNIIGNIYENKELMEGHPTATMKASEKNCSAGIEGCRDE